MFSKGVDALLTFCEAMRMLALSLALFRCSFVCWLPWFSGLILGVGWEGTRGVLWTLQVRLCISTQAPALVGSGTGTLSGMVCMVGVGGKVRSQGSIYSKEAEWGFTAMYILGFSGCITRAFRCFSIACQGGIALNFGGACPSSVGTSSLHQCLSSR